MSLSTRAFVLGLLCVARPALAEVPVEASLAAGSAEVEARAHLGVATAPFDTPALDQAKGQAFVFAAGARYAFSELLSLELAMPLVLGSVAQPAGSYVDAAAVGNAELGARWDFLERRSDESVLRVSALFEVGAPLASHAPDLMPNRVLAIADGIEGRGRPEWFTPGVLPITGSSLVAWTSAPWTLAAELRLPLLVRVNDADLPSGTSTHAAGFAAVAGGEARYRLSRRFSLASAVQVFFDVAPVTRHAPAVSRVQDFERLSVHVHFGPSAALVMDLQTALFGALGGSTLATGLRASVSFR